MVFAKHLSAESTFPVGAADTDQRTLFVCPARNLSVFGPIWFDRRAHHMTHTRIHDDPYTCAQACIISNTCIINLICLYTIYIHFLIYGWRFLIHHKFRIKKKLYSFLALFSHICNTLNFVALVTYNCWIVCLITAYIQVRCCLFIGAALRTYKLYPGGRHCLLEIVFLRLWCFLVMDPLLYY